MRIAITGALGHIGSFLIRKLPEDFPTAEFILIDNLKTQRYTSLFNLPNNVYYEFHDIDVKDHKVKTIINDTDIVVHLAALTDASSSIENAKEFEHNNFLTTKNLSNICKDIRAKFIMISSTSVYGKQIALVDEDCALDDLKPQSPYAETKLLEENFLRNLSKNEELKCVICRFGTIYGVSPGMRFHTAVNKFCWQAAFNKPITVWKTAYEQQRPYLDLNDAVRAISHIIKNNLFDGEIYNILTDNLKVRDIINLIRENIPQIKVDFIEHEIMNQLSYKVSNNKFKSLDFKFYGNIADAIKQTLEILKNKQISN